MRYHELLKPATALHGHLASKVKLPVVPIETFPRFDDEPFSLIKLWATYCTNQRPQPSGGMCTVLFPSGMHAETKPDTLKRS
jgi:hypothetical protein